MLKTIKDIFDDHLLSEYGFTEVRDELKQEAIKHLKNVKYDEKLKMHYIQVGEFRYGFIAWIEDFFNLTESDLEDLK